MKKKILILLLLLLYSSFYATEATAAVTSKYPSGKVGAKPKGLPPDEVTVAEADRRLKPLLTYLEKRTADMSNLYNGGNAKASLEKAFIQHGVGKDAMGYADAWGGWLYLTWDATHLFYNYHRETVEHALYTIHGQHYAKKDDLTYLEKGVAHWKTYDEQVKKLFEEELDLRSRIAVNIEQVWAAEKIADRIKHDQCNDDSNCKRAADAQVQVIKDFGTPIRDRLDVVDAQVRKMGQLRLFNRINEERFVTTPVKQND